MFFLPTTPSNDESVSGLRLGQLIRASNSGSEGYVAYALCTGQWSMLTTIDGKKATTSTAICLITRKGKPLIGDEYELFHINSLLLQWYGADEI